MDKDDRLGSYVVTDRTGRENRKGYGGRDMWRQGGDIVRSRDADDQK